MPATPTSVDLLKQALNSGDPELVTWAIEELEWRDHPLNTFQPRPDHPENLDEMTSFVEEDFPGIQCLISGNGAGKTYCGSYKTAKYLLEHQPPAPNTPFWVLSETRQMVSANVWCQNLKTFIPDDMIRHITWFSRGKGLPESIVLKPHANGNNWIIELKSYDMDRSRLQGANIGGAFLDEQAPHNVLVEVLTRLRKWPGPFLYTLTPLKPDPMLLDVYETKPPGWKFYRLNTREAVKAGHCSAEVIAQMCELECEELVETRLTGAFAAFEGLIYKSFGPQHIVEPFDLKDCIHSRGIDFGWSHNTTCVWAARDKDGTYYIYREYAKNQTSLEDHIKEINEGWHYGNPYYGQTWADYAAGQERHEFQIRGLPTLQAHKEVVQGIAKIQSLLRQGRLKIFSTCKKLIRELKSYQWQADGKPLKADDDLVDALRYCVFSEPLSTRKPLVAKSEPEAKKNPYQVLTSRNPYGNAQRVLGARSTERQRIR